MVILELAKKDPNFTTGSKILGKAWYDAIPDPDHLIAWEKGFSDHGVSGSVLHVPDFSCCAPKLKSSSKTRQAFMEAYWKDDRKLVGEFLFAFLRNMLIHPETPMILKVNYIQAMLSVGIKVFSNAE